MTALRVLYTYLSACGIESEYEVANIGIDSSALQSYLHSRVAHLPLAVRGIHGGGVPEQPHPPQAGPAGRCLHLLGVPPAVLHNHRAPPPVPRPGDRLHAGGVRERHRGRGLERVDRQHGARERAARVPPRPVRGGCGFEPADRDDDDYEEQLALVRLLLSYGKLVVVVVEGRH